MRADSGSLVKLRVMRKKKSCGFLIFCEQPERSFLLMRHPDRYDLPKGHIEKGETELECAYRELEEETGLTEDEVRLEEGFRYQIEYQARYKRYNELVHKTVVFFLGWIESQKEINLTEHQGHEWFRWDPPHQIEVKTVDALLAAAARHFETT